MNDVWLQIFLKVLEGPFLIFVALCGVGFFFRKEFGQMLSRGNISLVWGDKSFSVSDLPEELDENFAPLNDDITDLKEQFAQLEKRLESLTDTALPNKPPDEPQALDEIALEHAKGVILKALKEGQYRWRSIDRLAIIAMVSKEQVQSILRSLGTDVVVSIGKSGRTIARLASR